MDDVSYIYWFAFLSLALLALPAVSAMQAPCSQDRLMNTSDFVVEGRVMDKVCREPVNMSAAEGCYAQVSNCSYSIKVKRSMKGQLEAQDIITYNSSVTSHHPLEGSDRQCGVVGPTRYGEIELNVNDTIRFYHPADPGGIGCPNYIEHIQRNRTAPPSGCGGVGCMMAGVIASVLFLALLGTLLSVRFWRR